MSVIHELPEPLAGFTHIEEGRWHTDRAAKVVTVELRGGRILEVFFSLTRSSGYPTEWYER